MKKYMIMCLLISFCSVVSNAQLYTVTGKVLDEKGIPLPGCHVHYQDKCSVTDLEGLFIHEVNEGNIHIIFSFIGYDKKDTSFVVTHDVDMNVQLVSENQLINEIAVVGTGISTTKSKKNEVVDASFMRKNQTGTFIKSIERIAGVNAMDIGATSSKPIIRGMGFNRVVVSENGVKQEGQQWGADHGLELDPFSIETAEVVKGASGLEYGSDAIGGYINVTNNKVPVKNSLSGEASLLAKSVNDTYGGSVFLQGRKEKTFFKLRLSALDFGDYRVPTDQIVYLSQKMPIYNNRLKNTAGNEKDFSALVGRVSDKYKTTLSVSNVNQKSGFFPGAHGIPDNDRVKHDGDYRNVDYPYQKANHFKVLSQTKLFLPQGHAILDLGFQDNKRQEWSAFHTHYPNQPIPDVDENLELDFRLKTYSANLKYQVNTQPLGKLSAGLQYQLKDNDVAGYNYFLPQYDAYSVGAFAQVEKKITDKLKLNGGIRYDQSNVKTLGYFDEVLYDYFISRGDSEEDAIAYAQRSYDLDKDFGDISWLVGLVYKPNDAIIARMNVGKAFRMPTAIELGANGIHHGSFRHEMGDSTLNSEKGYYLDGNIEFKTRGWEIELSPYMYYFTNYLYLQPTGEFSQLPHGGQIYRYSQTEALLSGLEFSVYKSWFNDKVGSLVTLEYIYNKRISEDESQRYPLPFTPPFNGFVELDYKLTNGNSRWSNSRLFVNSRFASAQNRISNNEELTDGYVIFGGGISSDLALGSHKLELTLQASNIFNTKYYNHVSFYRQVEIPEPGRNFQLLVKVPF
ncbi:TonB-dependent receptor [Labilibacter marinus]|uniref:TonB-dependent receptor n=1 Tax=Labilibacter marinus TaxID=1477105 RepID=UPI001179CC92|nr:TonB-dependent receptor [Labilibacter marinus]